ncbi:hypothetical protein LP419_09990 [Massilia sp. H-1]|nr:hypothetical protein LP419_09990 [Massilia sp. H-1]
MTGLQGTAKHLGLGNGDSVQRFPARRHFLRPPVPADPAQAQYRHFAGGAGGRSDPVA